MQGKKYTSGGKRVYCRVKSILKGKPVLPPPPPVHMQQKEVIRASARFVCFTRSSLRCSGHLFITAVYFIYSTIIFSTRPPRQLLRITYKVLTQLRTMKYHTILCSNTQFDSFTKRSVVPRTPFLVIPDWFT